MQRRGLPSVENARWRREAMALRWLATRHSLRVEALAVLAFYATYELARAFVAGDRAIAVKHAHVISATERSLRVFAEPGVQDVVRHVPGVMPILASAYLSLHLLVTTGLLLWLHQRRPEYFARVRAILVVSSFAALAGFLAFPTAPPRIAGIGLDDTVSGGHVDLNKGLVSALYNPYAAVPSLHVGYAAVVGVTVAAIARKKWVRALGAFYPAFVTLTVVATGNHFFVDAAAGVVVVGFGFLATQLITRHVARERTRRRRDHQPEARVPTNTRPERAFRLVGQTSPLRHGWSHR
jgi:PAP2 superfamily